MAIAAKDRKKPVADRPQEPKSRSCLMCGTTFKSSHFGERVCSPCKGTATWRSGALAV
jgi:hypothetical protein